MRPLKRSGVNKHRSAAKFRRHAHTTKAANMRIWPTRGGWRF